MKKQTLKVRCMVKGKKSTRTVSAGIIDVHGVTCMIHRPIDGDKRYWTLSEYNTGLWISGGHTQKEAIQKASEQIEKRLPYMAEVIHENYSRFGRVNKELK